MCKYKYMCVSVFWCSIQQDPLPELDFEWIRRFERSASGTATQGERGGTAARGARLEPKIGERPQVKSHPTHCKQDEKTLPFTAIIYIIGCLLWELLLTHKRSTG